jgi:hypothetical protein
LFREKSGEVLDQRSSMIGSCGAGEAGAAPFANITVQRELGYNQHTDLLTTGQSIPGREVHTSVGIFEDAQIRYLVDHGSKVRP